MNRITRGAAGEAWAPWDSGARLMLRVRADDPDAFGQLVGRYQHRLLGFLNGLVRDAEDAEDLAQEVFLQVYRARKRYQPRSKLSTWLFTIARNLAKNFARDIRRGRLTVRLGLEQPLQDPVHQPSRCLEQEEVAAVVRRAVDELGGRQRQAVLLNLVEGLDQAAIARALGLTPKAVKSLLCRARANLRRTLQGYVSGGEWPPRGQPCGRANCPRPPATAGLQSCL